MRARVHIAASALLGFALALAPWTIRNAAVFHEFVPVNDAAPGVFYLGNSDWMVRFYRLRSPAEYLAWSRSVNSDMEGQTARLAREGRTSVSARARYFVAETLAERAQDPA